MDFLSFANVFAPALYFSFIFLKRCLYTPNFKVYKHLLR